MTQKTIQTIKLAFGRNIANTDLDELSMQERMAAIKGWVSENNALGCKKDFFCQTAAIDCNGLKLLAIANSQMLTNATSQHSSSVFIPVGGEQNTSVVNGRTIDWGVGNNGLYAPIGERLGNSGIRSLIIADVNHDRLKNVVCTMLNSDILLANFNLDSPKILPLFHPNINFSQLFLNLSKQLDILSNNHAALNLSGLDDHFYRTIAMWMYPEWFFLHEPAEKYNPKRCIGRVRDYVFANINKPITLTQLEAIAQISRRNLQYLFLKTFDKTPMQWIRDERLKLAHHHLMTASEYESVTSIAMSYGFYSPSQFATYYKQKFGCSPSQTLRK